jgi:predicted GIY-YIG superfamily endonuclease
LSDVTVSRKRREAAALPFFAPKMGFWRKKLQRKIKEMDKENKMEITETANVGTVYLLHFSEKLSHAQHYIGWAKNLSGRLYHHRKGTGAKLLRAVIQKGLDFELAETWENRDKHFERKLKNRKKARRLCPVCRGEKNE